MVQFDVYSIPQHIKIKKQFDAKIDDEIAEYYTLPQLDANAHKFINSSNTFTPFRLEYPMISQGRINYELCAVETRLAMYYKDVGLLLSSATTYETIVTLALSLFGTEEDSSAADQIFLRLAAVSCLQALESYSILGMADKIQIMYNNLRKLKTA